MEVRSALRDQQPHLANRKKVKPTTANNTTNTLAAACVTDDLANGHDYRAGTETTAALSGTPYPSPKPYSPSPARKRRRSFDSRSYHELPTGSPASVNCHDAAVSKQPGASNHPNQRHEPVLVTSSPLRSDNHADRGTLQSFPPRDLHDHSCRFKPSASQASDGQLPSTCLPHPLGHHGLFSPPEEDPDACSCHRQALTHQDVNCQPEQSFYTISPSLGEGANGPPGSRICTTAHSPPAGPEDFEAWAQTSIASAPDHCLSPSPELLPSSSTRDGRGVTNADRVEELPPTPEEIGSSLNEGNNWSELSKTEDEASSSDKLQRAAGSDLVLPAQHKEDDFNENETDQGPRGTDSFKKTTQADTKKPKAKKEQAPVSDGCDSIGDIPPHEPKFSSKKAGDRGKSRGSFDAARRREVAETRKRKACLRCRFQKQRCLLDPIDPEGECVPCKTFSKTSKKTIHRSPCYRKKITDVVLYRKGGLGLTSRWDGIEMKNVGDRVSSIDIRTIAFTVGAHWRPIQVRVVRFNPRDTDVTARKWTTSVGGRLQFRYKELAPYCLVDIQEAATHFEKYIVDHALEAFVYRQEFEDLGHGHPEDEGIFERTYMMAVAHYFALPDEVTVGKKALPTANSEKRLLGHLFTLWFATRHTRGSSHICSDDKLGMEPEDADTTYPLHGKVGLPRMILAQFDSITYTKVLAVHGKKVLRELEAIITQNQRRLWFTIYISLFILLSEASWISKDRYRHARETYGPSVRYSIPGFVEELQDGCNMLLMHWHYYNCRPYPKSEKPEDRKQSFLAELTDEQYELVMETRKLGGVRRHLTAFERYKKENGASETNRPRGLIAARVTDGGIPVKPPASPAVDPSRAYDGPQRRMDWDDRFYWVSQLFEENWRAHPTYQREPIPS